MFLDINNFFLFYYVYSYYLLDLGKEGVFTQFWPGNTFVQFEAEILTVQGWEYFCRICHNFVHKKNFFLASHAAINIF